MEFLNKPFGEINISQQLETKTGAAATLTARKGEPWGRKRKRKVEAEDEQD